MIPGDIAARGVASRVNGTTTLNGLTSLARARSTQPSKSPSPVKVLSENVEGQSHRDVPFSESPAIVRTQAGMTTFRQLDHDLEVRLASLNLENEFQPWGPSLEDRLRAFGRGTEDEVGEGEGDMLQTYDGDLGEKRKLCVCLFNSDVRLPYSSPVRNGYADHRPRKRARTLPEDNDKDLVDLWWDAMGSEELIGNGLPSLEYVSSDPVPLASSSSQPLASASHPQLGRPKKRKKKKLAVAQPGTLLYHMNNNIKTMRKVRSTHAKYSALTSQTNEDGTVQSPEFLPSAVDEPDEVIDEQPWIPKGSGIDIGAEDADACLHWAGSKILEHGGFQGGSSVALNLAHCVLHLSLRYFKARARCFGWCHF